MHHINTISPLLHHPCLSSPHHHNAPHLLNIKRKSRIATPATHRRLRVFSHQARRRRRVADERNWSEVVAKPSERSCRWSSWSPRSSSRPTLSLITSVTSAICTLTLQREWGWAWMREGVEGREGRCRVEEEVQIFHLWIANKDLIILFITLNIHKSSIHR